MEPRIYNRDRTEYPEIFKYTYWGGFLYSNEKANIIENRNRFIREYDIKNHKQTGMKKLCEWLDNEKRTNLDLDHVEIYITNDKQLIVITSPYNHVNPSDFEDRGWTPIYPLYNRNAYTFMKEFNPKNIPRVPFLAL
jgi:hypothetical protein